MSLLFRKPNTCGVLAGTIICVDPISINLTILYDDAELIVINKPAGIPVLPDGWEKDAPYLVKLVTEQFGKIWVVHRLDKTTSGVMIFARTKDSHRSLSMQFEQHESKKIYIALVVGNPDWDQLIVRHPLRVNVGHSHRTIVDDRSGKPCETTFRVMERFRGFSLLEANPATGRTHQIRVHAFATGFPLLGDPLYGDQKTGLIPRPALHAESLTITHPVTHERTTYIAPKPDDILRVVEKLRAGP
jgi:RluA family pseudouridine synthase